VKKEIIDHKNKCSLSDVSLWEIAIKLRIKKLTLKFPFERLEEYLTETDIALVSLSFEHMLLLKNMEVHHKDPFDHIIIAQGITEKMTIITKDSNFPNYHAKLFWK
jgi:PIN domain nuclease of toxin-antitoxin system